MRVVNIEYSDDMMKKFFLFLLGIVITLNADAQCTAKNTAFKAGESITYNLYYNWQFVWVKAGTASMNTTLTTYKGKQAYRTSLQTKGNGKLDDVFVLRDTLMGYYTTDMVPLYYRKGAREGKRYYVDEVFYSYPNGVCQAKMHQIKNSGAHKWNTQNFKNCLFDMVNIFMRARSFDPSNWKKGYTYTFNVADGTKALTGKLRFSGRTTVKADDGKKYNCLQLAYSENLDGKDQKIADFFVTDDLNHIPVRLDMHLKFGSAKAYLVSAKGLRN